MLIPVHHLCLLAGMWKSFPRQEDATGWNTDMKPGCHSKAADTETEQANFQLTCTQFS